MEHMSEQVEGWERVTTGADGSRTERACGLRRRSRRNEEGEEGEREAEGRRRSAERKRRMQLGREERGLAGRKKGGQEH